MLQTLFLKIRFCKSFYKLSRSFTSMCQYRSILSSPISNEKAGNFVLKLKSTSSQIKKFSDKAPPISEDEKLRFKENYNIDLLRTEEDEKNDIFRTEEEEEDDILRTGEEEEEEKERSGIRHEKSSLRYEGRLHNSYDLNEVLSKAINTLSQETVVNSMSQLRRAVQNVNIPLSSVHSRKDFLYFLSEVRRLYSQISGHELVRILHYFVEIRIANKEPFELYVKHLLQILPFHLNSLSVGKILDLHASLKKIATPRDTVESFIFCLPILMEKHLQVEVLSQLHHSTLLALCGFCVKGKVKNSYKVFEELGERNLRPNSCVSVLWNILDLPFLHPGFKFMIPPEKEIIIEILAKECFTLMVNNIKNYTPYLLITTLKKIGKSFRWKKDLVYHEYFLQEISRRALEEDWNSQQLIEIALKQYNCNYIDEKLLHRIAEDLGNSSKTNLKILYMFFPFSCMDEPPEGLERCISAFKKLNFMDTLKTRPYLLLLAASIWNMGYSSKFLLERLFNPAFFQIFLKDPDNGPIWAKSLLLMNFIMERDPSLSHLCLFERKKNLVLSYLPKESYDPCSLQNIIKNPSDYMNRVLYKQAILIDKLLVLDESGRLVSLSENGDQELNSGPNLYESLNIDASHRRIAILNIPRNFIFTPERKLLGMTKLAIKIMESEGFDVIQCLETESEDKREEELKKNILHLGVNLSFP